MLSTSIPRNRRDPLYKYYFIDFSGSSFLAHPDKLIVNRHKWSDTEIANYLGLASFRNLGEYKATGKVTLDLDHCPMSRDALNRNRLLRIEDDQIHFRYEDYKENK